MTAIDFDELCYRLAEASGKEANIVRAEIEGISQRLGVPLMGAAAKWKNDNQDKLGKTEYFVTVLRKSPVREYVSQTRGPGKVADLDFVYTYGETTDYCHTTIWNEAIDATYDQLETGKSYKFLAVLMEDNQFRRIADVEEVTAYDAPSIDEIVSPTLAELDEARLGLSTRQRGMSTFVRGWIGSMLTPQGGGDAIGFRLFDVEGETPLTVWFGGEYTRLSEDELADIRNRVGDGTEVATFGYVPKEGRFRMNAEKIWPMEG